VLFYPLATIHSLVIPTEGYPLKSVILSDERSEESEDLLFWLRDSGAGRTLYNPSPPRRATELSPAFQGWENGVEKSECRRHGRIRGRSAVVCRAYGVCVISQAQNQMVE
jgi:hypothetical protein